MSAGECMTTSYRPLPVSDEALERVVATYPNEDPGFALTSRREAWTRKHLEHLKAASVQIVAERAAVTELVRLHRDVDEWLPEHHDAALLACEALAAFGGAS